MKTITCKFLQDNFQDLSEIIVLAGKVKTFRDSKNISFVELNDGSLLKNIQLVIKKNSIENFQQLTLNSAIVVHGKVILTPSRQQPFEVSVSKLEIRNMTSESYPLQKKEQSLEFLRENQEYRSSTLYFQTIFRLKSKIIKYMMEFLDNKDFMWVHTPILTTNDAEGGGDSFEIKNSEEYFLKKTYLTVSGQLTAEPLAQAFKNVYTFGPTFRAEKSDTTQHVSEFWMLEPEISFCNYEEAINVGVNLLSYVSSKLKEKHMKDILFLEQNSKFNLSKRIEMFINKDYKQITYKKAIKLLSEKYNEKISFGDNLSKDQEIKLCRHFEKMTIITNFPLESSPFYMYDHGDKTTRSFDFILSEVGEIIGGSQREDRYDILRKKIDELGLNESLQWYLDLRKHGYAPSSGFGLGVERLIMYFLGVKNIRDVQFFPRSYKHVEF